MVRKYVLPVDGDHRHTLIPMYVIHTAGVFATGHISKSTADHLDKSVGYIMCHRNGGVHWVYVGNEYYEQPGEQQLFILGYNSTDCTLNDYSDICCYSVYALLRNYTSAWNEI